MAILYIDPINGSDTNPAQVTNVTASQSGTLANIASTGHGLSTGNYVILNNFSSWLNQQWQITVVDANNFTLNGSVWQTTADATGNYYHQKATSWATAWKTLNGCTTNYIRIGDEVRFLKSPNPVSIGNATWTNASATVTLATAQTATIDNCETAWTASNTATVTRVTTTPVKQGTYKMQIQVPAVPATATKYAYYTLPATLDLSAYQEISFWLHPVQATAIDADTEWEIKLCSDTTGDTVVDTFKLKSLPTVRQGCMTIIKDGGGNLGNSIKSIAVYTGTTTPTGNNSIMLDNIIATKSDGLNLNTVISKCNVATYDHAQETWFSIMSIVGTTITLDVQYQDSASNASSSGKFYYYTTGTSPQTVTTYARPSYALTPTNTSTSSAFSSWATSSFSAYNQYHTFSGGWDKNTETQDGMTFYDLLTDYNYFINFDNSATRSRFIFKNFGFVRGLAPFGPTGTWLSASNCKIENIYIVRSYQGLFLQPSYFGPNTNSHEINNISSYGSAINLALRNSRLSNIKNVCSSSSSTRDLSLTNSYVDKLDMYIVYNTTSMLTIGNQTSSSYFKNMTFINNNFSTSSNASANLGISCNNSYFYNIYSSVGGVGIGFSETASNNIVYNLTTSGNHRSIINTGGSIERLKNYVVIVNYSEATLYANYAPSVNGINILGIDSVGNNPLDNRYYISNGYADIGLGYAFTQQTTRHTASDVAWQINVLEDGEKITEDRPLTIPIAKFAVNGSGTVTFKAWVKLSDNTKVGAKIYIPAYQVSGFTTDVSATKASDNNWEELSVTFTPNKIGVVEAYIQCWNKTNTLVDSVYVDDISISQ